MSDFQSALKSLQHNRQNTREDLAFVAQEARVITIEEFVEEEAQKQGLTPEQLQDKDTIRGLFSEQDAFVAQTYMGKYENKKPQLVKYKPLYTQFHYDDYTQFLDRVLFEKGFADHFGIRIVGRLDMSQLEPMIQQKKKK